MNRFEQFLFNTAADAIAFAKATGSPKAKIHLDTYHMNLEEDNMFDAIRLAGGSGRLGHFHVGESNRRVPGLGPANIDWKRGGQTLAAIDYRGAVVMEPFGNPRAHNAKRTHTWRDLSRGADLAKLVDDVRRGGDFIRRTLRAKGVAKGGTGSRG